MPEFDTPPVPQQWRLFHGPDPRLSTHPWFMFHGGVHGARRLLAGYGVGVAVGVAVGVDVGTGVTVGDPACQWIVHTL